MEEVRTGCLEKEVGIDLSGSLLDVLQQAEEKGLDAVATEKAYNEYFSFHTRKKAVPYHGLFELTPLCNLNCKMCACACRREADGERNLPRQPPGSG